MVYDSSHASVALTTHITIHGARSWNNVEKTGLSQHARQGQQPTETPTMSRSLVVLPALLCYVRMRKAAMCTKTNVISRRATHPAHTSRAAFAAQSTPHTTNTRRKEDCGVLPLRKDRILAGGVQIRLERHRDAYTLARTKQEGWTGSPYAIAVPCSASNQPYTHTLRCFNVNRQ